MPTSLQEILASLDAPEEATQKTAAAKQQSKVKKAEQELIDALARVESTPSQKTASVQRTPVSDLEKMASIMADAEQEALLKEAGFYGAAVADGFMSRINMYNNVTAGLQKEAAYGEDDLVKIASAAVQGFVDAGGNTSGEDTIKIAEEAVRGYVETQEYMRKTAEAAYAQGYHSTMAEVEKVASAVFSSGAEDCAAVLRRV